MTRNQFRALFLRALGLAATQAEDHIAAPIPRSFRIALHAPGCAGRIVGVEQAIDELYLGSARFYRIIDVSVLQVQPDFSVAFARVSGHPSTTFDKTWDPNGLGPFKPIAAEHVEDQRAHSK